LNLLSDTTVRLDLPVAVHRDATASDAIGSRPRLWLNLSLFVHH